LKFGNERTARERAAVNHVLDRRLELVPNRVVLRFKVQERNFHVGHEHVSFPKHWSAGLRHGTFQDRRRTTPCRRPALRFMGEGLRFMGTERQGTPYENSKRLSSAGRQWWPKTTIHSLRIVASPSP